MPIPLLVLGALAAAAAVHKSQSDDSGSSGLSDQGLQFIKRNEGFSAYSYNDARGRSIGYGHFIKPGDNIAEPISEPDAETLLAGDVQDACDVVDSAVTVDLNQYQYDALVDFAYNIGGPQFRASTLVQLLNNGDYNGAGQQFGRWIYEHDANGVKRVSGALQTRRAKEAALFNSGVYS